MIARQVTVFDRGLIAKFYAEAAELGLTLFKQGVREKC